MFGNGGYVGLIGDVCGLCIIPIGTLLMMMRRGGGDDDWKKWWCCWL